MKYALAVAATLAATPALAGGNAFIAGFGPGLQQGLYGTQQAPQAPQYVPTPYQPLPQIEGPQYQTFTFQNGNQLRCTTIGSPGGLQSTRCY